MKHANVAIFVPHAGCPHQCSFCNQRSISGKTDQPSEKDVEAAVKTAIDSLGEKSREAEIAFFGGSFTAIKRDYMLLLLNAAEPYVKSGRFKGIRISTRPDAIDEDILNILKEYGVTAIELGAQSMDNHVLELNGRGHTAEDVVKASQLIKKNGFELGLQMMTGLYGDSPEGTVETAKKIIELAPQTVRIYPTIVIEKTELADLLKAGKYKAQSLEEAVSLCSKLLIMFYNANIKVIRLGLHSGGNVDEGYIAGPWHPSFRELCEGEIYLKKVLEQFKRQNIKGGKADIFVSPSEMSKMIGQKRRNIEELGNMGFQCRVIPDKTLSKYEIKIRT